LILIYRCGIFNIYKNKGGKKMKNTNKKKGFTLIELLAVIVILAILIAAAVPAISGYLAKARESSFKNDAHTVLKAVQTDRIADGIDGVTILDTYSLTQVNETLDTGLVNSSYGNPYNASSYVTLNATSGDLEIFLTDGEYSIGLVAAPVTDALIDDNFADYVTP
jgi:prepilin-type N-terminal cleavage/methylation domain-containing protein